MKAKIISFDEVLDKIKTKNTDNIFYVNIRDKEVEPMYDVSVSFLAHYSKDCGFFIEDIKGCK